MRSYFTSFLLVVQLISTAQTNYTINDPEKLSELSLQSGDQVVLKDGTYSSDERISFVGNGTEQKPIIFKSETPGGVIFTGGLGLDISGNYLIVDGFYWNEGEGKNNHIQFRKGENYATNCTIQNCAINNLEADPSDPYAKHRWIVLYGTNNTVKHCSFTNKKTPGALLLAELAYNKEQGTQVNHRVEDNYFYNYEKRDDSTTHSGDSETIRIGTSSYQDIQANIIINHNYFNKSDGENEIISNKSAGNTYSNNTFKECRGSLVLRHGADATIKDNFFLGENTQGTGGIRIVDSNHSITGNVIKDCINTHSSNGKWNNGITFIGGTATSGSTSNGYQKTQDIYVADNVLYNVHHPIYFNNNKGKNAPSGIFENNKFYQSQSDIINGDYDNMGDKLDYNNNTHQSTLGIDDINGFVESNDTIDIDKLISNAITDDQVGDTVGCTFMKAKAVLTQGSELEDNDTTLNIDSYFNKSIENKISITPNPFSSYINISYKSSNHNQLRIGIYELSGRIVFNENYILNNNQIHIENSSIENLKAGVYLIKIQNSLSKRIHTELIIKK